ncbi:hypothetical protein JCGZ_22144 [Jatropha curcas]|uniref:Uncharacterized protein n=1 Tax=Jatropha curcas TaxID=180498 RepID=A0A067L815_JATCU|nr:hypothetical protein JCGZ_22144 [Jatropha curcas]
MVRDRAFDSDAFDSGSRGGCGRGYNTRGRGGTIPPPSSSGTSGASSSTQPPVLPSLPSIPSSSTPFPGPAEKYGREPTSMEVFTYTHTKGHDGNTFVDRGAMGINENYSTARERLVSSQTESEANSRPQPQHSAEEFTALRARVDEQERQLAELKAHVMQLSAQQQPLPSRLDPNTANDTLVTPADTTTHPTGTPLGDRTLDRVDNQPRRFDFGPF